MPQTPVPNQIISAVKETVDTAFQQGLVGAFLIFMFAVAVIAVAILVYIVRRPARSTGEKDVNLALSTLADKQAARAEKKEDELKEQAEKHNKEMKAAAERANALTERAIAASEQFTVAILAVNQTNKQIAGIQEAVKNAVTQMAEVGSLPLQDVQKTVNRIEGKVKDMSTVREEDKQLKEDILNLLREVDGKLSRIDERLKTKEVDKVVPLPAPQPEANPL